MAEASRRRRSHWPLIRRGLTLVFFIAVAVLIATRLRTLDWREVGVTLRNYEAATLWAAAAIAAMSYLVYGCFDLLGRLYTRHAVPPLRVMLIAMVSYAFNLNLGALVGGVAFRYRLYSRHGLDSGRITRVLGLSLTTNWLGYLCLAGLVFALRFIPLPPDWNFGQGALQALGVLLLAMALGYLLLCAFAKRRSFHLRQLEIRLPAARMGLVQLGLSSVNWLLIASILWVLLHAQLPFVTVLAVLLVSSIAAVIVHIPAGLGVLEAVFLAFLGRHIAESELLAALIAYRAIYYLAPLLIGSAVYAALEARARKAAPSPVTARHGATG